MLHHPFLDRRTFLISGVLAPVAGCTAQARGFDLLDRAMVRAGGRDHLGVVRAIGWRGSAVVYDGSERIDLGVDTRVEPLVRARSRTWLARREAETQRTMEVDRLGGRVVRNGQITPLEPAAAAHERAQFSLYAAMLLTPIASPPPRVGMDGHSLIIDHPDVAPTTLIFDDDAKLIEARNRVPSADGGGLVGQAVTFMGEIEARGVLWPSRLSMTQNDTPYFDLQIDQLWIETAIDVPNAAR